MIEIFMGIILALIFSIPVLIIAIVACVAIYTFIGIVFHLVIILLLVVLNPVVALIDSCIGLFKRFRK